MRRSALVSLAAVIGPLLASGGSGSEARRAPEPVLSVQPAADCVTAFTEPVTQPLPGYPRLLLVTDLNNDSVQDLVATTDPDGGGGGSVAVLLGNGSGFGAPASTFVGGNPRALSDGDFNSDGRRDVVVSTSALSNDAGSVTVLFGNGAGGFSSSLTRAAGTNPFGVIAGDFSQDGHDDIIVSSESSNPSTVLLLQGDGAGNFGPLVALQSGLRPKEFAAGDFNGDGRRDLAVVTADDRFDLEGFVELRLANAAGGFDAPALFKVGWQPDDGIAADFNEDGRLDLVVANLDATVSVLLGNGAGSFAPQIVIPTEASGGSLEVADFDGDGHLDLASENIDVLLGDGSGGFARLRRFHPSSIDVRAADVNADGRLDLVSGVPTTPPSIAVMYGRCATPTDLSLEMTESRDPVLAGHDVDYVFRITNHGPEGAAMIGHFTFSSRTTHGPQIYPVVPSQGSCGYTVGDRGFTVNYTCNFGSLAATAVATVNVKASANSTGGMSVTASLEMDNPHVDPNPADNSAEETTTFVFVGGGLFNLGTTPDGAAMLSWNGGGAQGGFLIGRWAGGTTTVFPQNGIPLPREATSFVDPQPIAGALNCYSLAPLGDGGQPYGRSHLMCMVPGSASPSNMLQDFAVHGSAGGFQFTWSSPGGQTGYVVFTHPLDGSAPSHHFIPPDRTVFTADSQSACHSVGPLDGSTVRGHSSVLCVIPGFSTLYP